MITGSSNAEVRDSRFCDRLVGRSNSETESMTSSALRFSTLKFGVDDCCEATGPGGVALGSSGHASGIGSGNRSS
jgi:hypothetical protein